MATRSASHPGPRPERWRVLVDEGASTVLHARERYLPHTRAADASCRATLAASAVMTHRMLHTVKALAESH